MGKDVQISLATVHYFAIFFSKNDPEIELGQTGKGEEGHKMEVQGGHHHLFVLCFFTFEPFGTV